MTNAPRPRRSALRVVQRLVRRFTLQHAARLAGLDVASVRVLASTGVVKPSADRGGYTFADVRALRDRARDARVSSASRAAATEAKVIRLPTSPAHVTEATNAFVQASALSAFSEVPAKAEARRLFLHALALNPSMALAYVGLASLCEPDEAAVWLSRAAQVDPTCAITWHNLGVIEFQHGNLEVAALRFKKAIRLQPNCAEAHFNLGLVLEAKGFTDQAVSCFAAYLQLKPNGPAAAEARKRVFS